MDPDNNPPLPLRRRRLAAIPPAVPDPADGHVLLRVATSCPRCGPRPALRVTQAMVRDRPERLEGHAGARRLHAYTITSIPPPQASLGTAPEPGAFFYLCTPPRLQGRAPRTRQIRRY